MQREIKTYHRTQTGEWRKLCDRLGQEIDASLRTAESKIWHGCPVWFLDGNPIVGYHKLKDCVRLLFWSGQSFKEPTLKPEGSFKAAEIRYTELSQIRAPELARWLRKAKRIQWDYKNIVKRGGRLVRLDVAVAKQRKKTSDLPEKLSNPARNALKAAKITTLKKLATFTEADILDLHGVGPGTIPLLWQALKEAGFSFKR